MPFTRFHKMHGAGNDFVVLDARDLVTALDALDLVTAPDARGPALSAARVRALADRRTGIGCDQLVAIEPGPFLRIRNADGSEAGACGNATRCVAALLHAQDGRANRILRTPAGELPTAVRPDGSVEVDMGPARLDWRAVPLARAADTLRLPLPGGPAAMGLGNPHATLFVPDLDACPVAARGAALETDPMFPERANIGFAQVLAPDRIRLRVWERGAGLTRACGSGACAALVNAHRRGLCGRRARVEMDGGDLEIAWREADGHVLMTGPAVTVFEGAVDLDAFPP